MENITSPIAEIATTQLFIKMVISNWELQNKRLNDLLGKLSDEQLTTETAPDRNSGVYIFGHLIAVSDGMLPLLGLGEKLYPQLENIFLTSSDKSGMEKPSIGQLKEHWQAVNTELAKQFALLQASDWFARHATISTEAFAKEPHRNKLNILMNRTNHQSYHIGQLIYLL